MELQKQKSCFSGLGNESEKKVLNRCSVVLLYAHKTLLCYALVHHSYFMLPHSRSILFPVKKMKWVKFGASQSPLCPRLPQCRPGAWAGQWTGIYLPSSSRVRSQARRLLGNIVRLSSTVSDCLAILYCFLHTYDQDIFADFALVENNWFK